MLCIYYPINFHAKKGNVDEEYMNLLTSYHDCMLAKFKENVKEAVNLKLGFQEILEEGLQYGENTSEYSWYRKSKVNDEGRGVRYNKRPYCV